MNSSPSASAGTTSPPAARALADRFAEWSDRNARWTLIMPAVLVILAFSIFPLLVSAYLSLSRFKFVRGGFDLKFIGFHNYKKLLFGSEQFHFLGKLGVLGALEWTVIAAAIALLAYWLVGYVRTGRLSVIGMVGRLITTGVVLGLVVLSCLTLTEGGRFGSLMTTLFYVMVGCSAQFAIGLGLALLCAQPVRWRTWFRVIFFLPLMVTPVGIAYCFRMLADMAKGPFAPLWAAFGLGDFSWASDPWTARLVVVIGDSWQWIPFIFVVLLAAIESQPRDQVEAAQLDGAGPLEVFRDITWPSILPVAATVMLIRVIEAFKIIDLPNVLTNGGPGVATESMTFHAFTAWRTLDLGGSAAVAYMLLFVTVVLCLTFFNLVVLPRREAPS